MISIVSVDCLECSFTQNVHIAKNHASSGLRARVCGRSDRDFWQLGWVVAVARVFNNDFGNCSVFYNCAAGCLLSSSRRRRECHRRRIGCRVAAAADKLLDACNLSGAVPIGDLPVVGVSTTVNRIRGKMFDFIKGW